MRIPLYARAGIPEAWLLDLPADCVEAYRQPGAEGYQYARSHSRGQPLTPEAFPDITLTADDLLG